MIEQEPLTLELYDAVMGRPAYNRIEDHALIGERSVRIVADGIAEEMTVASRIAEIVLAIILMHPRSLEEAMRIACLQRFAVLIDYQYAVRSLSKLLDVITQTNHEARQGGYISRRKELCLLVSSRTEVDATFLHQFLRSLIPL